jgi:hypothetical protein
MSQIVDLTQIEDEDVKVRNNVPSAKLSTQPPLPAKSGKESVAVAAKAKAKAQGSASSATQNIEINIL